MSPRGSWLSLLFPGGRGAPSGDSRGMSLQPEPLGIREGKLSGPMVSCTYVRAGSFSAITEQITAADLVPRRQSGQQMWALLCCPAPWLAGPTDGSPQASPSLQKPTGQARGPALGLVSGCVCPSGHCSVWVLGETLHPSPGEQYTGGIWEHWW